MAAEAMGLKLISALGALGVALVAKGGKIVVEKVNKIFKNY